MFALDSYKYYEICTVWKHLETKYTQHWWQFSTKYNNVGSSMCRSIFPIFSLNTYNYMCMLPLLLFVLLSFSLSPSPLSLSFAHKSFRHYICFCYPIGIWASLWYLGILEYSRVGLLWNATCRNINCLKTWWYVCCNHHAFVWLLA